LKIKYKNVRANKIIDITIFILTRDSTPVSSKGM